MEKICKNGICEIIENGLKKGDKVDKVASIKRESITNYVNNPKARGTYYTEDNKYIKVYNFPAVEANRESKQNVIYSEECIKNAIEQYKYVVKNEQPFLKYMLDGHEESDSFSRVVGAVDDIRYDNATKTVYIDFTIFKSSSIGQLISDILAKGDPIGVSMVLFHTTETPVKRSEIKYYFDDVETLDDISENLSRFFGANDIITFVDDQNCYIVRFDLTFIPSMNNTYSYFQNTKKESLKLKLNKSIKNTEFSKISQFKEIKESLKYALVNTPLTLQMQSLISQIIENKIDVSNINPSLITELKRIKNFDLIFSEKGKFTNIFNTKQSEEYINKISSEKTDFSVLENLLNLFKEIYSLEELYSFTTLYDIVKLLTYVYLNNNLKIEFSNYKFTPEKEIKVNRLKTFLQENEDLISELKKTSEAQKFFMTLFNIIDNQVEKYKNILTAYGSIVEALKLLTYIVTNNIDINYINETSKDTMKEKKASMQIKKSAKKIIKKLYV